MNARLNGKRSHRTPQCHKKRLIVGRRRRVKQVCDGDDAVDEEVKWHISDLIKGQVHSESVSFYRYEIWKWVKIVRKGIFLKLFKLPYGRKTWWVCRKTLSNACGPFSKSIVE